MTLLKNAPTGFEEYYVDAPLTPAEHAEEKGLYDRQVARPRSSDGHYADHFAALSHSASTSPRQGFKMTSDVEQGALRLLFSASSRSVTSILSARMLSTNGLLLVVWTPARRCSQVASTQRHYPIVQPQVRRSKIFPLPTGLFSVWRLESLFWEPISQLITPPRRNG